VPVPELSSQAILEKVEMKGLIKGFQIFCFVLVGFDLFAGIFCAVNSSWADMSICAMNFILMVAMGIFLPRLWKEALDESD
jgi:hypothetical protein